MSETVRMAPAANEDPHRSHCLTGGALCLQPGAEQDEFHASMHVPDSLCHLLGSLDIITLGEMEGAGTGLLTRMEDKYVIDVTLVSVAIEAQAVTHKLLKVNDASTTWYRTLYYDDPSFCIYHGHHNGKGNRFRRRFCYYSSTDETFLEVKKKTNKGTTEKHRMKTEPLFLESVLHHDYRMYHPVLCVEYCRFTLVSRASVERVICDTCLVMRYGMKGVSIFSLVVVEHKYARGFQKHHTLHLLRRFGIRMMGFSKDCTGISLLKPWMKRNSFKPNLLMLERRFCTGGAAA